MLKKLYPFSVDQSSPLLGLIITGLVKFKCCRLFNKGEISLGWVQLIPTATTLLQDTTSFTASEKTSPQPVWFSSYLSWKKEKENI